MKKVLLVVLVLTAIFQTAWSQDWQSYAPLSSKGEIPKDFTEAYTNKYKQQREQISAEKKRRTRKTEDDFYRKSEFFINDFLVSGNVIFGDTLSEYCETIISHLLKNKPELRSKLRVYTVKSPSANAFATASGIIFVNLGLLAEIENEAQLASILAHEIIHYENNHVLDQYVEQERITDQSDLFNHSNDDDKLLQLSTYAREKELEADSEGFNRYFARSGYAQQEALLVMDVLQYSYLPFDEIPFEASYLKTEAFELPAGYLKDQVAAITAEADYDDSHSSHPNIKKRKDKLKGLLKDEQGRKYLISKQWFEYCQRAARYENTLMYLQRRQYAEAIYSSFLLSKKYGEDRFQRLSLAKALAGAATYRNNAELKEITTETSEIEGESQQVYHILESFGKKDLNTLAVAYSYELVKDYPSDRDVERVFRHNLYELVFTNKMKPDDFLHEFPEQEETLPQDSLLNSIKGRSSKIRNIKEKTTEKQVEPDEKDYYLSAFVPYFEDTVFTNLFSHYHRFSNASTGSASHYENETSKYDDNIALGIDRIVCMSPLYLKLDERSEDGIRYLSTDEQLDKYRDELTGMAGRIGLDMKLLDYKNLNAEDVDSFNDLSLLKAWVNERISHGNTGALVSNFEHVQHLREKYQTDYIAYTGNLSLRIKETAILGKLIYGALIYPAIPFIVADLITPEYKSLNFFFLFDLRDGQALLADYNNYPSADREDYIRSIVYNHLIQIKDKPEQ